MISPAKKENYKNKLLKIILFYPNPNNLYFFDARNIRDLISILAKILYSRYTIAAVIFIKRIKVHALFKNY